MYTEHGLNSRQNTLFVLLIFSASRSRKREEKKNKLQNGKSKEEIEMEKWLAFGMFKFLIHVCANAGDKGNIQRTMPNSTN